MRGKSPPEPICSQSVTANSTNMRRLAFLFPWLFFFCAVASAQFIPPGFPPGTFNSRAPLDASGGTTVQQVDTNNCTNQAGSNSYSVSQTISSTANGLIVIAAANDGAPNETLTATWNGTSMTALANRSNTLLAGTIYIFGLRAPTTGTQTLTISMLPNPTDRLYACSVSFSGVNQTSDVLAFPVLGRTTGANNQTGAGPFSINITSATGHMVASGAFDYTNTNTDTLNLTQYGSTSSNMNVVANYGTGATTVTSTLTVSASSGGGIGQVGADVSN